MVVMVVGGGGTAVGTPGTGPEAVCDGLGVRGGTHLPHRALSALPQSQPLPLPLPLAGTEPLPTFAPFPSGGCRATPHLSFLSFHSLLAAVEPAFVRRCVALTHVAAHSTCRVKSGECRLTNGVCRGERGMIVRVCGGQLRRG